MARDFYPFVEETSTDVSSPNNKDNIEELTVRYETRIAVYDDVAAAPRVVVIEPTEIRSYLEEIVQAVNRLSHEQGGQIPFMVMRDIVENFIHAHLLPSLYLTTVILFVFRIGGRVLRKRNLLFNMELQVPPNQ